MSEKSAKYLKNFLWDNHISITNFARLADIARFTVYNYLKGGNVRPKTARHIKKNLEENSIYTISVEKLID